MGKETAMISWDNWKTIIETLIVALVLAAVFITFRLWAAAAACVGNRGF